MTFDLVLSSVQQRLLALLLLALPLGVLAVILASSMAVRAEHHKHVAILKREIGEYRAMIKTSADWKRTFNQLNAPGGATNLLFNEREQVAAADFQSRLAAVVNRDGGKLTQSTVELHSSAATEPAHLESVIGINSDIKTLTRILYDLRAQRPLMVVNRLSIKDNDGGSPNAPAQGPHVLYAELSVDAFIRLPQ